MQVIVPTYRILEVDNDTSRAYLTYKPSSYELHTPTYLGT